MEDFDFKKAYGKLQKEYKLPDFKELNEHFEVEKIDSSSETLPRVIRKTMMEKLMHAFNFIEMLLNPMNAPRMYHAYLKGMALDDKKRIDKIYSGLSELSILSLEREIDYDEKAEVDLINKTFKDWKSLLPEYRVIFKNMKKPNGAGFVKERSYFG